MDFNDPGLAADLSSSSSTPNPLYVGQPGYFTAFDVDTVGGGTQDVDFRKHDITSPVGRFLGTTSEWTSMSSSSDAGYAFAPNTNYVGVFTITRTATDTNELTSSLSLAGGALLDTHTTTDSSAIANNFGMLGFWVNGNTFGSSNVANTPDNGLIFTNVTIETTAAPVANAIINDSFADGNRTSTGALDADWWSSSQSSGSNLEIAPGGLTLVTGTSGRGMHATFTPQTLEIGDSISVTYSFTTPATVGAVSSTSFKIALMDFNDPGLADDLSSSSSTPNPLYVGQPGYFTSFDVDPVGGGTQDTDFREHDTAAISGRFLGTTSEWISISSSADAGYAFAPNTDYVGTFTITRTGVDSHDLSSSLSLAGGALLDSHTASDTIGIANNFGMLGFWVNANAFGSSNSAGTPDNGLTFTNVLIQSTAAQVSNAVIDDSFADGNRVSTGALDADWWSSSQTDGSNVQIDPGALTLVTGTSGRGMHATFAPQVLDVGDNITVTYSFTTPSTIGNPSSTSFKIALMDLNDGGLQADQSSSSSEVNPLYVGQPGYFTAFDVSSLGGGTQDTDFRKHDVTSPLGRFLGTTSEWNSISSSGDAGYAFLPNTNYVGVFSITRTGTNSHSLSSSLSIAGGALVDSHTATDNSDIANNFGMVGFWANANAFGSSNTAGDPDNGLVFTNVLIESTGESQPLPPKPIVVPMAPFAALVILAMSMIGLQLRSRSTQ